jgi:hypothetical protein
MGRTRIAHALAAASMVTVLVACNGPCGLALHRRATADGTVAPGASFFQDFLLRPEKGDMEIDLSNSDKVAQPVGPHDAYLTDTSCAKLFDGPFPGSAPLCKVLVGPATSGKVSARAALQTGTYRLWVYGHTSNASDVGFLVDVDIWDYSCGPPIR